MAPKTGYVDVKIRVGNKTHTGKYKMEVGCSFENNGAIYRMNNDGLLSVFDKKKQDWIAGIKEIEMTNYQLDVFEAVANNNQEKINGKKSQNIILSKADIDSALAKYRKKELNSDLQEFIQSDDATKRHSKIKYSTEGTQAYSIDRAFSTVVIPDDKNLRNDKNFSTELIFKYGSAQESLKLSDYVHNDVLSNDTIAKNIVPNNIANIKDKTTQKNTVTKDRTIKIKTLPSQKGRVFYAKNLKPSSQAINLIKKREKFVSYTYDDLDKYNPRKFIKKGMKYKGTLTIGYGHTRGVKPGMQLSKKDAEKLLVKDMKSAVKAVKKHVKVKITQNQFDALVSFVFNVGERAFKDSQLLKYINANRFKDASNQFPLWKVSNGQVCRGLINRRAEERKVFLA